MSKRDIPLQQTLPLLLLCCLADALKAGGGVDLPNTGGIPTAEQGYSASSSEFDQLVESKLNDSRSRDILSRQRRYLTFPEGSSFQVGKCSLLFNLVALF